ncbi:leucine repeat adapter protein 25 [Latimeria chalumnae]|uniref:Family with sequence similarity 89 member B n=1 Tax=Latimeria chalumnae TaxID=7897 RepID=H3ALF8_LATCH|nr:PREDICTED: protein FAM89B [Latimeria chalumnae]XP_005998148.1 PREDICTED: protein FAM89B [Latimeria chalumnae]|eukprot:XP_005998147.1 PREDICTED: protein FAM89B [Latimeria chalumnae]
MNGFAQAQDGLAGNMCSIEGLPPLPKGLSGILNSSGGSWREIEKVYSKKTRIQDDLSKSRIATEKLIRNKPANLDAALAILRKEMVGLRQLDVSLLCQLWSLHESIQEYKGMFSDMSSSMHSEGSFAAENGFSDEEEEFEPDQAGLDVGKDGIVLDQLRVPEPQNSRDQWIKDSFHITI